MPPRPTDGKPRRDIRPLRERLSLRTVMTWTNVVSILAASLIAGYYALTVLYQNKLSDTWAIMFLELEHQGTLLADRLEKVESGFKAAAEADGILRAAKGGRLDVVQGGFASDLTLEDFNLEGKELPKSLDRLTVLTSGGEAYLARVDAGQLLLRKLAASIFEVKPAPPASQGALYLLTREGRLLYASDPTISETNVAARPLVQQFIHAPIKQGQMELTDPDRGMSYGFFAELPQTNIVMFSEVRQAVAMAPVRQIVLRFLGVLGLILIGAVVILQLPLSWLTDPVRELAQLAMTVGQGRFDVNPSAKGFGELSVLTSAFSTMAIGLVERDRKVAGLMHEQAERARLAGELAIARRIQENLLPARPLPLESGLLVASEYISAAECAGDWYHYTFDEKKREAIVIIADVSGHGAGSSMFTAIIAGLFDEFRSRDDLPFDMATFATRVNDVMYRLGRQQWHATMMIARHTVGEGALDILLAGHPRPIVRVAQGSETAASKAIFPGSTVVGMSLEFEPTLQRIPFPKGTSLLMYTDGLTEAVNRTGKPFARRRVHDVALSGSGDPSETLSRLLGSWRAFLGGVAPQDDVCVIAMRAL
jgi:serine phosphatase RsbU (regulator of sigma subunit)/HAMP domain-containing protein